MREHLGALARCSAEGGWALATVVATRGSAPRPVGTAVLVGADGTIAGSLSGGCIESAVHEVAQRVLATGTASLQRYGVADEDALAVGTTCGGELDVLVERVEARDAALWRRAAEAVAAEEPVVLGVVVEHPDPAAVGRRFLVDASGSLVDASGGVSPLGPPALEGAVAADAADLLGRDAALSRTHGTAGGARVRVCLAPLSPRRRLLVFGSVDVAAAAAAMGAQLGFRVTVCDARAALTTPERFPGVQDLVVDLPHRYLARERDAGRLGRAPVLLVLTHDARFDVPLLRTALHLPELGYLGAMGSRRTHEERAARLAAEGLGELAAQLLRSPLGLDLGGSSPAETALSVLAEVVAVLNGRSGRPLSTTTGPLHGSGTAPAGQCPPGVREFAAV
ncbi:XdhC family protein [Kineococcus gypseus]|uniref:XdhC family protein n=1 Tax=Kineococcus gypseus TaxID=1637102 RepID=UPI003D7E1C32